MKRKAIIATMLMTIMLVGCGSANRSVDVAESEKESSAVNEPEVVAAEETADAVNDSVSGNGSFFVSVNDKVYFRKYDADTFSEDKLNSEYANMARDKIDTSFSEKSEICVYDPATKKAEKLMDDNGYGEMYYLDGFFYLNKKENGTDSVYKVNIDTMEAGPAGDMKGKLVGIDEKNDFIVTYIEDDGNDGSCINVYKDDSLVADKKGETYSLEYLGIYDGKVYCSNADYGTEDEMTVFEMSEIDSGKKEEIKLGSVTPGKIAGDDYLTNWEVGELIKDKDTVYISMADYEGSASCWNGGLCLKAKEGEENSLEVMYDCSQMDEGHIYLDAEGKVAIAEHKRGSYNLSGLEKEYMNYGDLLYYETEDRAKTIVSDFIKKQPERSGFSRALSEDAITKIGDTIYMMLPNYVRDDVSDIGWREYNKVLKVGYYEIAGDGEITLIDEVDTSDNFIECDASFANDKLTVQCVGVPAGGEETNEVLGEQEFEYSIADDVVYIEDGNAKTKDDFVNYVGSKKKRIKIYFNNDGEVNKIEKV